MSAWDFGPGNVDDTQSFNFSDLLSGVTDIAKQAAAAVTSIRGSVSTIQGQSTNTRTDDAVKTGGGVPLIVWAIGLVILYKVAAK